MKIHNILSATLLTLALGVSTVACSDYLDVRPSGEKVEGDLFDSPKGFEAAIYGVYGSMVSTSLYGQDLLWGLTDIMAQDLSCGSTAMTALAKYDYENQYVRDRFASVWTAAYQTIGYANNVIKNLNNSDLSLPLRDVYMGEMLATRALMHFEMLRLFASTDPSSRGIPYAETWDFSVKPFLTVAQAQAKIEGDLIEAEKLLAPVDEPLMKFPRDDNQYDSFMNWRETHMNVWAVRAILARFYAFTGKMDKAGTYAKAVITSEVFPLVDQTEVRDFIAGVLSPKETIFGLYAPKYINTCKDLLYNFNSYQSYTPYDDISGSTHLYPWQNIYNEDMVSTSQDTRISWFRAENSVAKCLKLVDYAGIANNSVSNRSEISGVNIIRVPELYLIAAEAYFTSDPTAALGYYNDQITSRGLSKFVPDNDNPFTLDRIYNEFHKELFCEGQQWFNMKRLKKDFLSNDENRTVAGTDDVYVVPVPVEEFEYRPE